MKRNKKQKVKIFQLKAPDLPKSIQDNLPFKWPIVLNLFLSLLTLLFVYLSIPKLPTEIPLFYGLPESEEQIASDSALAVPGLVSLVVLIINSTIAYLISNEFIKKTLITASFSVSILALIATLEIIFLVGSF